MSLTRRLASGIAVAVILLAPRLEAQARTIANLVVCDAVVAVQAATDKQVNIGIGTDTQTSTITASAAAVDQFVAETEALVRLGARPIPPQTPDRPELQDGTTGRALSVTRHIERQKHTTVVTFHFFVSDPRLTGYVVPATVTETKAVLLALHRAARAASAPPAAKKGAGMSG